MNKLYIKVIGLFLLFVGTSSALFSQNVGINTSGTNPSTNAILDLSSGNVGNMGLIVPHVSIASLSTFNPPIANAVTAGDVGMLVYNTNGSVGNGAGYYYWNGTTWVSTSQSAGTVTSCATAAAGYFPYFTNTGGADTNLCASSLYQSGTTAVGVGTITPKNMLDVSGASAVGSGYAGSSTAPSNGLIVQGQTGIGTSSPNGNAELDVTSSLLGVLIPRMASAPSSPATSLLYYNTTSTCFMFYNGSAWQKLVCSCSAVPATPTITGPTSYCINSTGNTYSVTAVGSTLYYTWHVPSALGHITSGQGTNVITVKGPTTVTSSAQISVAATNSCGTSNSSYSTSIVVDPAPSAFTISQTNTYSPHYACPGTAATFSVASVAGVTYAWSVSSTSCGTISGSSTSNTVTVTAAATGATGTVTCVETNTCGSTTETYSITTTGHGSQTFSFDNNIIQNWSVPSCITVITITATGASGGNAYLNGSLGATLTKTFTVVPGDTFDVVVGGTGGYYGYGAGGGGASFVWLDSLTLGSANDFPIIAAGGGGGGGGNGGAGQNYGFTSTHVGANGSGGTAGTGETSHGGGGGAGWFTNTGTTGNTSYGYGGDGSQDGFLGGSGATSSSHTGGAGGFGGGGGGGGASNQYGGGGGGGGFSGGGGGKGNTGLNGEYGGVGGSSGYYTYPDGGYATASKFTEMTIAGTNSGSGSVIIYW